MQSAQYNPAGKHERAFGGNNPQKVVCMWM